MTEAGIIDLLSRLRAAGIQLRADGEQLRFTAKPGALTPELKSELGRRKQEILRFLKDAGAGTAQSPLSISPVGRNGGLPLSFAQQRLWFLNELQPDTPNYNMSGGLRLEGNLNIQALENTLNDIVRRHESLRTLFVEKDGQAVQMILAPEPLALRLTDLSSETPEQAELKLRQLSREEARKPFDLSKGPLFRIQLIRRTLTDHLLVYCMHHIISDGWSMAVFRQEVAALYEAFAEGRSPALPELRVQYADFAFWQRNWLQGARLQEQLSYWKNQLSGAPALLELPISRARPALQTFNGSTEVVRLPKPLVSSLESLGWRQDATLYMVMLAAFNALIHRYTGQQDILVGSPIANRQLTEIEPLIGFFVNTLIMRTDCSGDPKFVELVSRVRETALAAYAHQDLPFEKLVEELHPERNLSHTPIFQIIFALQNVPRPQIDAAGVRITRQPIAHDTSKFDIALSLWPVDGGLDCSLEYNTDLFEREAILRLLHQFVILLDGIATDPGRRLSELPLITAEERRQIVIQWNQTAAEYPNTRSIHSLFEEQAAATPDSIAVQYDTSTLTYCQLNERANRLANRLQQLGVHRGTMVGLCMERSCNLMVALLAILKAGGAYAPFDPAYPAERIVFMIEDTEAPVILTEESLKGGIPATQAQILCIDSDWGEIEKLSAENLNLEIGGDDIAYMIYTSGSTGRPKGILIAHRAVNRLVFNTNYIRLGREDVVAQASNASFDAATFEIWGALLHGGRLAGIDRDTVLSPATMAEEVRRLGVTTFFLTTALFNEVIRQDPAAFCGIKNVLFGGEAVDPRRVRECLKAGPPQRLLHVYGPTEVTTFALWHEIREVGEEDTNVPIGLPISNTTAHVLDANGQPVPVGLPGELCLGGDGLARGYHRRPELMAEKFIVSRLPECRGERLYRTGDLVSRRSDGAIEFLGRIDHQVKIRGFRIELGEIESVLARHPQIKEAVVIAREDAPGHKRLVAYLTPQSGEVPAPSELRALLKTTLPDYMVPSAFVTLEKLPLNPNGKVDRKALPAPGADSPARAKEFVAPRTSTEEKVAAIWREVLNLERVGSEDHFFELGGHSLLATQAISRVRAALGVNIPLRALFEGPTVAQLAERIDSALEQQAGAADELAIERVPRNGEIPLSFAQQRLWFLNQLEPDAPFYNITSALRLEGPVNVRALERALGEIVRRHEALRTTIATVDGRAVQRVAAPDSTTIEITDLSPLPREDREQEARTIARDECRRAYDLEKGALFHARLLKLGDDQHILIYGMHHIVSDGWSMAIFSDELTALYGAFAGNQPSPLQELSIQYCDFAHWQRSWLQGPRLEQQLAYWRKQLSGANAILELSISKPRPSEQTYYGASETVRFPASLRESLEKLALEEDATLYMVLLAAFGALLHRYSGQSDILVGSPIANRHRKEIEPLIGFFVNTLVLRADCSGNPTLRELTRRVREAALGAYAHQDLPFERLVDELQVQRSLSHSPLFQVMFALQNMPRHMPEAGGIKITRLPIEYGTSKFDMTVALVPTSEGLQCSLEYNTDLFEREAIVDLLEEYRKVLEQMADDPACPLAELELSAPEPRVAGQSTARPSPAEQPAASNSAAERKLTQIWKELLGVKKIAPRDNFFELGGDSILIIQVIARARKVGLEITPKQFFRHQTIAELAAVAREVASGSAEEKAVEGFSPLTPIQRWFFDRNFADMHHWNQAFLFELKETPDFENLRTALGHVIEHHDALRFRYECGPDGWKQRYAGASEQVPIELADFSGVPLKEQDLALTSACERAQAGLSLQKGPLIRAVYFDLGPERAGRLMIAIHHLVVDGVSWRILIEDLELAYQQLCRGEAVRLPAKTASFKRWAEQLADQAKSDEVRQEAVYWLARSRQTAPLLAADADSIGMNTEASAASVATRLSQEETRELLQKVPAVYNTQINDILLAALALAFQKTTGAESILIHLEGHGREELGRHLDISRTVGWFTSVFPVELAIGAKAAPGEAIKKIKEQLRRIPNKGIGYGLLHYLSGDAAIVEQLAALPEPELAFNYLGQFDSTLSGAGIFSLARESAGPTQSPAALRPNTLDVVARVAAGELQVRWLFSENIHRRATIENVANAYIAALRDIIAHCRSPEAGGYTPSDFALAGLSQNELNDLIAELDADELAK